MRTVRCSGRLMGEGLVSAQGCTPPPTPVNRILDTRLWKHYLSATLFADGKYPRIVWTIVIGTLMVYSHWLGPESGPGQGQGLGRMGCMVLIRTFHTAPEQGQGRTPGTFSGPEEWVWYPFFRSWKCALWWILVFFPIPVQVQCERFLLKPYNPFFQVPVQCERFCIILVPDQASVTTP